LRIIIRNLQAMSKQNELTVEAYINAIDSQRQADFRTLFELIQANVPKDLGSAVFNLSTGVSLSTQFTIAFC